MKGLSISPFWSLYITKAYKLYCVCVFSVGFGFVGFDSEEVVEKLAAARFHTINGKSVC